MATLLDGVNAVLKRVTLVGSDNALLTNLVDSPRQSYIDTAIQVWNEAVDQLYALTDDPKPNELVETTITLMANDRDYLLPSDLVQIHWPLIDETNGLFIRDYPGGYSQMVIDQIFPNNYQGVPHYGAIRPTDGQLYLDYIPQAEEEGRIYRLRYDRDVYLVNHFDSFPFKDVVFRAMVPAVAEMWKREKRAQEYSPKTYKSSMALAAKLLNQRQQNTSWLPHTTSY